MPRHQRPRSRRAPAGRGFPDPAQGRSRDQRRADRADRDDGPDGGRGERLQKVLAAAGIGSRRDCEEWIRTGRVAIDKVVVTELGTRVDPLRQEIRVDGEPLRQPKRVYFAINKPMGVVTTNFDPSGRPRVIDLVNTEERVFAVGRLDRSSEGLILVTNDGEFSNRITHPRYGVEKTYLVRVAGSPGPTELARLRKGVYLSDGYCRVQSIAVKGHHKQSSDLLIVLNEGRNRELRRILARVGHKVLRLKRIAIGPIKLADLPLGAWRKLMPGEIDALLAVAKENRKRNKAKGKKRGAKPGGMKPVGGERTESPAFQQQQAMMTDPLSLDDLLRDDLDEGGVIESSSSEPEIDLSAAELEFSNQNASEQGGYGKRGDVIGDDADEPPTQKPFRSGGKKPFRRREGAPRERFARQEGGPNKRFAKPGGKKFGKPGGKKFGKPTGGKFGHSAGGKPSGKPGGKKFGKPGGKKFGKGGRRGRGGP